MQVFAWLGITVGTFAGGAGLAFLGDINRRFAAQIDFFSRISSTMQVDQGLAESLRLFLDELAISFGAEEALLLYRDTDLERIFLWRLKSGESERLVPESMPLSRDGRFSSGRFGRHHLLEFACWPRFRIWLGPAGRAPSQVATPVARPRPARVQGALIHDGRV